MAENTLERKMFIVKRYRYTVATLQNTFATSDSVSYTNEQFGLVPIPGYKIAGVRHFYSGCRFLNVMYFRPIPFVSGEEPSRIMTINNRASRAHPNATDDGDMTECIAEMDVVWVREDLCTNL